MIKKLIAFLSMMVLSLSCNGDPINEFMSSYSEQEAVIEWVDQNTHPDVSREKIKQSIRTIYANAQSNGINPLLIVGMVMQESRFNERARSFAGAVGLMQVIPKWHYSKLKKRNPYNPSVNIEVGITILQECLTKGNNNMQKAMRCYSGGAKNYYSIVTGNQRTIARYVEQRYKAKFNQQYYAMS